MAVALVGTPSTPGVQVGSLTPSVTPTWSGTQPRTAGDLLLACCTTWGQATVSGAIPTPTGWTSFGTQPLGGAGPQSEAALFWKAAAGGDTAPTVTSTLTGTATSCKLSVELYELSGANTTTPFGASGTITATSGTSMSVATSGNVPSAGCVAVSFCAHGVLSGATATYTVGTGFTNTANDGATSGRMHSAYDTDSTPSSGATLTDAMAWTTAYAYGAGIIVVVQPAVANQLPQMLRGRHINPVHHRAQPGVYGR